MKPQYFAAVVGFLLLTALGLLLTGRSQPGGNSASTVLGHRTTVIGEGEVRAKPNLVRITVGILTTDRASAAEAEALNLASSAKVRAAFLAADADAEQLDVTQPTIEAVTDQDFAGGPRITGFRARVKVTAVIRSPAKMQAAIDLVMAAGATSLEEVAYGIENPEAILQEALTRAMGNARNRAETIAKTSGIPLGQEVAVQMLDAENPVDPTTPKALSYKARVRVTYGH